MISFQDIVLRHCIMRISSIESANGALIGANLKFSPTSEDEIYETSDKKVVHYMPNELMTKGIDLDLNALIDLNIALLGSISTYLFSFTKEIDYSQNKIFIRSEASNESKYLIAHSTKHFFRDKQKNQKGKYKIRLSIFDSATDKEDIMIPLTKKDVYLLSEIFRTIVSKFDKTKPIFIDGETINATTKEVVSPIRVTALKSKNTLVIGDFFLHGQELLNLMYIADKLVHSRFIELKYPRHKPLTKYKQVICTLEKFLKSIDNVETEDDLNKEAVKTNNYMLNFDSNVGQPYFSDNFDIIEDGTFPDINIPDDEKIMYLILKKYNEEDVSVTGQNGERVHVYYKLPISARLLTMMYLYLTVDILRIDAETSANFQHPVFGGLKGVVYTMDTLESHIGIAATTINKKGENETRLRLMAKVKDRAYSTTMEDGSLFHDTYFKDGELKNILPSFDIDLQDQWPKLVNALAVAYTQRYLESEKKQNLMKFFVTKQNKNEPPKKYEVTIESSISNKAPAVLYVAELQYDKDSKKYIEGPVYRQPLYEKYIFELLIMLLSSTEFLDEISFVKTISTKELMTYRYKSMKSVTFSNEDKVIDYGIKKIDDKAYWGMISKKKGGILGKNYLLEEQDRFLLNQSALFKLLHGRWQPFVGYNIAIGQDGFITDMYGEIDTTRAMEELNLPLDDEDEKQPRKSHFQDIYPDVSWAIKLYTGTLSRSNSELRDFL